MSAKKPADGGADLSKELTVVNKLGIHARPAAMFVKTANRFASDIHVEKDGETVNGKSIMGLMMLAAAKGTSLELRVSGDDERDATDALVELVDSGFGEEE
jgi:phosphocarrier protein HPr